jgi:hypothetical protein
MVNIPLDVIHLYSWKHKALVWFLFATHVCVGLSFIFVKGIYVRTERRATEAEEANLALMEEHRA